MLHRAFNGEPEKAAEASDLMRFNFTDAVNNVLK
jgi:hypothetical protein